MSRSQKMTPGPWEWDHFGDGAPRLVTPHSGRFIVMDFVRLGMQNAQPRFAERNGYHGGIMHEAVKLNLSQHPDACAIEAAPILIAALEKMVDAWVDNHGHHEPYSLDCGGDDCAYCEAKRILRHVKGPSAVEFPHPESRA